MNLKAIWVKKKIEREREREREADFYREERRKRRKFERAEASEGFFRKNKRGDGF
jgi:hypothetical protein